VATISSGLSDNLLFFRAPAARLATAHPVEYGLLSLQRQNDFHLRMFRMRSGLRDDLIAFVRADGVDPWQLNYAQRARYMGELGRRIVLSNIPGALFGAISGSIHLLMDDLWETAVDAGWRRVTAKSLLFPLAALRLGMAVIGFSILLRHRSALGELALITFAYFVGISSGPESDFRYFLPAAPFFSIAIGAGAHFLWERHQRKRREKSPAFET
jgi:hypothetical protein